MWFTRLAMWLAGYRCFDNGAPGRCDRCHHVSWYAHRWHRAPYDALQEDDGLRRVYERTYQCQYCNRRHTRTVIFEARHILG